MCSGWLGYQCDKTATVKLPAVLERLTPQHLVWAPVYELHRRNILCCDHLPWVGKCLTNAWWDGKRCESIIPAVQCLQLLTLWCQYRHRHHRTVTAGRRHCRHGWSAHRPWCRHGVTVCTHRRRPRELRRMESVSAAHSLTCHQTTRWPAPSNNHNSFNSCDTNCLFQN